MPMPLKSDFWIYPTATTPTGGWEYGVMFTGANRVARLRTFRCQKAALAYINWCYDMPGFTRYWYGAANGEK